MESYNCLLFSILKEKPHLIDCLVRCKHCRIYFITYYTNKNRKDLGCPFGCKEAHQKKGSARRSTKYYNTPKGRKKKCLSNRNRSLVGAKREPQNTPAPPKEQDFSPQSRDFPIERNFISYLRMVTSLIEGRPVVLDEIIFLVDTILRQRSFDIIAKRRYFGSKFRSRSP